MHLGTVLITGGAGFIGSHVVDALIREGYTPVVLDDLSSGKRANLPAHVALHTVDVCDRSAVGTVFAQVRPRFVCHLAAQISVSRSVREPLVDARVNVIGLLNVLEEAVRHRVERVVLSSSGGTLYGNVFGPADEASAVLPMSPYGISKMAGEYYLRCFAQEHGLTGVALRLANVYGPRQDPHGEAGVVAIFARQMLTGDPVTIFGDGTCVRDYIYVGDVARAVTLALESTAVSGYRALNIGTGQGTDVNRLEALLHREVEAFRPVPRPRYGPPRAGDLQSSLLNPALAQQVLGWAPEVGLAEGLSHTVAGFAHEVLGQVPAAAAGEQE